MDYKNGKIYRIVCNETGETYYGSTTQPLYKRLWHHKANKTSSSRTIIERNNYNIVLVEEYPCENKEQLLRRERYYIENNKCINNNVPTRTPKEYRLDNIEKVRENDRIKHINDRENRNERCRKWYKENKERVLEKEKIKTTCECGCVVRLNGLSRHKLTQKHIDKMKP